MLLCSLYLLVFLLLPNINLRAEEIFQYAKNKNTTPTYKQEESIFIDVIQNISRVNTALQELIENYEKIQKYYESNSFEKDLSSDAEIDQVYKNKKSNKRSKSISDSKNTKSPRNGFPATMMIGSEDDESERADSDEEVKVTEKAVVESILQTTEEPAVDKHSEKTVEKLSKEEEYHKPIEEQPHVMSFKKSDQDHETGESNKNKLPAISNHGARHNIDIKRTSAVSTTPSDPLQNKQFRKVEKVLRAEIFPRGMIWKEIAEKKPIKLRTLEFPEIQIQKVHFRSRPKTPKTAVVILAKNNKRTKTAVEIPSELEHVFSSESDVDTRINTAKVLRHADACIKMVVRKCWKACKEVKKIACRITTCKTSFKEKFLDNAKRGCIQAFKPPAPIKDNNETKTEDKKNTLKKHASSISSDSDDSDFLDATRTGFPAETCYPFMVPQARSDNQDSNTTITPIDEKKQILRDRYERACARASSEKCEKGCLYAYKKTCDSLECGKGKKRAFHKHCRRQCKLAYKSKKVSKSSSSSSSTSSSSDSDDSGDSDSFDTEDFE